MVGPVSQVSQLEGLLTSPGCPLMGGLALTFGPWTVSPLSHRQRGSCGQWPKPDRRPAPLAESAGS